MNWTLYYGITLSLQIVGLFVFHRSIRISALSVLPLILMLNCIFQAYYYHSHKEQDFHTAYSAKADINDLEWNRLTEDIVRCHLLAIPLFLPFVCFFTWGKLLSVVLFLVAFVGGSACFRIRNGKAMRDRYRKEEKERQEQQKKEEMGNIS